MQHRIFISAGTAAAVILSLGGLAASAVLLQHHVVIEVGGDPLLQNVCEATEHSSCDEVLNSKWGHVRGVPMAAWGAVFFVCITSWFLVVGQPRGSRRWLHALPVAALAVGTVGCAYLDYYMFGVLKAWCPFCLTTHIITAVLFILSILLRPRRLDVEASRGAGPAEAAYPSTRLVVVAVVLAAVGSAAVWSTFQYTVQKAKAREYRSRHDAMHEQFQAYEAVQQQAYRALMAKPKEDIPIEDDDVIRGDRNAPHTVVVFSDYQCPYCSQLEQFLDRRMKDYPGWFRIVFKFFPMNKSCNAHVQRTLHAGSCAAAVTAEAVRLIKGEEAFWAVHEDLFSNREAFARRAQEYANEAAERVGVPPDELWKRIRSTSTWSRISKHVEQAHKLGIHATPTIYFDGRPMRAWADAQFWRYMYRLDKGEAEPPPATQPAAGPDSRPAAEPESHPAVADDSIEADKADANGVQQHSPGSRSAPRDQDPRPPQP